MVSTAFKDERSRNRSHRRHRKSSALERSRFTPSKATRSPWASSPAATGATPPPRTPAGGGPGPRAGPPPLLGASEIRNSKSETKPKRPKSESQNHAASRRFEPSSFRVLNLFRISDFELRICRAPTGERPGVRITPESRILFLHILFAVSSWFVFILIFFIGFLMPKSR